MRLGLRGNHQHNKVDVSRNRLDFVIGVWPRQFAGAWQYGFNHAGVYAVVFGARAKHHPVAGDQRAEIGAQIASIALTLWVFHFHLSTEVSNDLAMRFFAEFAGIQLLGDIGLLTLGALGFFLLNFFDAPGLAFGQFAFGHEIVTWRAGYSWPLNQRCGYCPVCGRRVQALAELIAS